MAQAGFCSECNANVWINEDGSCTNGHPASAVSGAYETGQPAPAPLAAPVPKKSGAGVIIAVVLVVVVLFGCLVGGIVIAIGIPVFSASSESARQKACFSNQRTVEGAIEQYMAADPDNERPSGPIDESSVLITDNYIKAVPRCPSSPTDYYTYDAESRSTDCPLGDPPAGHGHY